MTYKDAFQSGLSSLRNQRRLFEIFVRSVLHDVGEEVSGMLCDRVVFEWRNDTLGAYCPRVGRGLDFARLTLIDGRNYAGKWEPELCLLLTAGAGSGRHWWARSRGGVSDLFAGMLACPDVARMVVELAWLRTEDQSEFDDACSPAAGEG